MATCTKNCNCCPCLLRASSVVEDDGIITITVADDSITDLCVNEKVCIGLFASIPNTAKCDRIKVTDGTTERAIYNGITNDIGAASQYWRPCQLRCRSILVLREHRDPELFVIEKLKGLR